MYNPMSLKGKRIVVTGGASGIGRATAIEVCQLGGSVLLLDIDEKGMEKTLAECSKDSVAQHIDLSDTEMIKKVLRTTANETGLFSGLVHCAGIPSVVPLRVLSSDNYKKTMEINTFSAIELAKNFIGNKVCIGKGASIVLISSVYGLVGSACNAAYAASKAAIVGITKSLGVELAPKGIRVNCIAPGFIKTNMGEQIEAKFDESHNDIVESMHPLGWGEASDISHGIAYLLSDASRWMTGSVMSIDGGYTAL